MNQHRLFSATGVGIYDEFRVPNLKDVYLKYVKNNENFRYGELLLYGRYRKGWTHIDNVPYGIILTLILSKSRNQCARSNNPRTQLHIT